MVDNREVMDILRTQGAARSNQNWSAWVLIIIMFAAQFGGGIWWASSINQKVNDMKIQMDHMQDQLEQVINPKRGGDLSGQKH